MGSCVLIRYEKRHRSLSEIPALLVNLSSTSRCRCRAARDLDDFFGSPSLPLQHAFISDAIDALRSSWRVGELASWRMPRTLVARISSSAEDCIVRRMCVIAGVCQQKFSKNKRGCRGAVKASSCCLAAKRAPSNSSCTFLRRSWDGIAWRPSSSLAFHCMDGMRSVGPP